MKNKSLITALIYLVLLITISGYSYYYGSSQVKTKDIKVFVKYTQKQIDSLRATLKPIEKQVIVYKDKREELKEKERKIVYPKEECKEIVENLKEQLDNCDSITVFQDKIIYVDREIIKKQDVIIEKLVLPKKKPFSVGFQLGYGTSGKDFQPYVGVGVSYNLVRF